jgi:hypothetical protein
MAAPELVAVEEAGKWAACVRLRPRKKIIFFARGNGAGEKMFFAKRTQLENRLKSYVGMVWHVFGFLKTNPTT